MIELSLQGHKPQTEPQTEVLALSYCTATSGAVTTSPTLHLQQCPVSALKLPADGSEPGGRFGSLC